jgi:hypothetical protein
MSDAKRAERGGQPSLGGPFARAGAEIDNLLGSLVPSEATLQHFTNARVEMLKGLRAIIDARIERLASESKKGVSVTIE